MFLQELHFIAFCSLLSPFFLDDLNSFLNRIKYFSRINCLGLLCFSSNLLNVFKGMKRDHKMLIRRWMRCGVSCISTMQLRFFTAAIKACRTERISKASQANIASQSLITSHSQLESGLSNVLKWNLIRNPETVPRSDLLRLHKFTCRRVRIWTSKSMSLFKHRVEWENVLIETLNAKADGRAGV